MVLKQQSNSLQEGPRCNPFTANGTGWSKGGCTRDTEEIRRALLPSCAPAPRLPQAGFQAQGPLAHSCGTALVPAQQPAAVTLLGRGRSLAHRKL